ncbi:hypothetical protein [Evansella cellulosilytica]|uniref:Uncharacterized protein n=1 Tax=Evansella cellulosilytica (strain ATCC 21833 / DSM 2522 / FERM P-1141 / JCM 9156 / N-4) TaxID=649639 RepID=E6TTF8_EVAC2|nr:hypothetical protein [Evansella cellulosilytica]ADU29594.1 hypothetical protein Bcell_1329 [Evansella cellulosilytica DSM 2522]
MNSAVQLGPFIIQIAWIVLAGGLVTGYLLLTYSSPFRGSTWSDFRETVSTSIGMFIMAFFFGTIPLKINIFISDPLAVISYPSGRAELYLAILLMVTYLLYSNVKKKVSLTMYLHGLLYILLPTSFIHAFFTQKIGQKIWEPVSHFMPWSNHPVFLYMMFINAILLIWLLRLEKKQINTESKVISIYFLWVLSHLTIALVDRSPIFFSIPITPVFYFGLLIIGIGVYISRLVKKKGN